MTIIDDVYEACGLYFAATDTVPVNSDAFTVTDGYSGKKILGLMQILGGVIRKYSDCCYAEVGVFKGLTLTSVATENRKLQCYGIDNFSQFDPDGENKGTVLRAMDGLGLENAHLLDGDFEVAVPNFSDYCDQKIGLYFFDGPHDYRSQLMGLVMALPHLAENAIIIIDDANYGHVQQATADFMHAYPQFKLVMEAYTPNHPMMHRNDPTEFAKFTDTWWNGIHVLMHDPENKICVMPPFVHANTRQWLIDQHPGPGVGLEGAVNRISARY